MNEKRIKVSLFLSAVGIWQIIVPFVFPYSQGILILNSLLSGFALIVLSILSMRVRKIWSRWTMAGIGLWLELAPLVFWAKQPAIYFNDVFIGFLVLCLSLHLFDIEERPVDPKTSNIPPGWSFNPSSFTHRIGTVILAIVCWGLATYMASYQLGFIPTILDPFFGDGTLKVITSKISQSFPVSDAGLGALCYSLDAVLGWQGGKRRWQTMPWTVMFFGILVVPVGFVSLLLIILQPVVVGAWCGLCLITAACMLLMILFTVAEVAAAWQYLQKSDKPFWATFWKGGEYPKQKAVPIINLSLYRKHFFRGITVPWNLFCSIGIGVWLLFSPPVFRIPGIAADSDYVAGPLLIAISVISLAEVVRSLRLFNIIIGASLIITPFLLSGENSAGLLNNLIAGIAIILLALPKGRIREHYGSWDSYII